MLPPGTDLHAHPLVARGALVLQDKASCFSAQALLGDVVAEGQKGKKQQAAVGDVIDACAAPGAWVLGTVGDRARPHPQTSPQNNREQDIPRRRAPAHHRQQRRLAPRPGHQVSAAAQVK